MGDQATGSGQHVQGGGTAAAPAARLELTIQLYAELPSGETAATAATAGPAQVSASLPEPGHICKYEVPDKDLSGDDYYGNLIRSQAFVEYAWMAYGFHGNREYWEHWGWDDCLNTDKPLARALNACFALSYSASNPTDDSYTGTILNWGRRFVREQVHSLRPGCRPDSRIAEAIPTPEGVKLVQLYLPFFYSKVVPGRAETLIHESRHLSGSWHSKPFPPWSALKGSTSVGADASWDDQGAWAYSVLFLGWFSIEGANTTSALKERARLRANWILNNCFADHPDFTF